MNIRNLTPDSHETALRRHDLAVRLLVHTEAAYSLAAALDALTEAVLEDLDCHLTAVDEHDPLDELECAAYELGAGGAA